MSAQQPAQIAYAHHSGRSHFCFHAECKPDKPNLREVPVNEIAHDAICAECWQNIHREPKREEK